MKGSQYMLLFMLLFSQYFVFQANIGATPEAERGTSAKTNNIMAFVVMAFILFIASIFAVLFCLSKLNKLVQTCRSTSEHHTSDQTEGRQVETSEGENNTVSTPYHPSLVQTQSGRNSSSPASYLNNKINLVTNELSPVSQTSASNPHGTTPAYPYIEEYPITSFDLASLTHSTSGVDISDYIPPDSEASASTTLHFPEDSKKDGSLKRLKQIFQSKFEQQIHCSQNKISEPSNSTTNQDKQEMENKPPKDRQPEKQSEQENASSRSSSRNNQAKPVDDSKRSVKEK